MFGTMTLTSWILIISTGLIFGDGLDKFDTPGLDSAFLREKLFSKATPVSSNPDDDPCSYNELKKPNFNKPGLRISKLKCYEYIWEVVKRDYDKRNGAKCSEYKSKTIKNYTPFVPYVIGGRNVTPGEFPHMGAVGWKAVKGTWLFLCGSSLISSKFMLTAAHCSKVSTRYPNIANTSPMIVRLGDKNIADVSTIQNPVFDFKIQKIIVHPKYASPKKYFDIAIIQLENNVFFDKYVKPACLWTQSDINTLPSKATVTGWGIIDAATLKTTTELQAAEVDLLNRNICNDKLKPSTRPQQWQGMSGSQMCAGRLSGGVDACQGDSGGPLQVKLKLPVTNQESIQMLLGITSFGNGCARTNTPAVYTRISSFIDWIENIVWPETS